MKKERICSVFTEDCAELEVCSRVLSLSASILFPAKSISTKPLAIFTESIIFAVSPNTSGKSDIEQKILQKQLFQYCVQRHRFSHSAMKPIVILKEKAIRRLGVYCKFSPALSQSANAPPTIFFPAFASTDEWPLKRGKVYIKIVKTLL